MKQTVPYDFLSQRKEGEQACDILSHLDELGLITSPDKVVLKRRKQEYTGFRIDLDTKRLHPKTELLQEMKDLFALLARVSFVMSSEELERALGKLLFIGRCSLVGKSKTLNLYKALNSGKKQLVLDDKCQEEIRFWVDFAERDPGLPMGFAINIPCTSWFWEKPTFTTFYLTI